MINLFAATLNERRILIHSTRLERLSACVQACNLIIYPMQYQGVLIPILPVQLLDYLNCPTPFIIGIHTSTLEVRFSFIFNVYGQKVEHLVSGLYCL